MSKNAQELVIKAKLQHLEAENKKLKLLLENQREFRKELRRELLILQPLPCPQKKKIVSKNKKDVAAVLLLGDWHIGEKINKYETEGYGEFNFSIAQERIEKLIESFLNWVRIQKEVYGISEFVILGLGDYISGNIHDELLLTQEFPVTVQSLKAGQLLAKVLSECSSECNKLRFYGLAADNHGRLFKKPQYKQKGVSNYSYIVLETAKVLVSSHENILFQTIESPSHIVDIKGFKFLLNHGDCIKSWAGIPYYGIDRFKSKETMKRWSTKEHLDYIILGHFHVASKLANVVINGSLTGTSELDHNLGRFSLPSQTAFMVSGKHGLFSYIEFVLN